MTDLMIRIALGMIVIVGIYHLAKLVRDIFRMGKEDFGWKHWQR